jgi:hypothetical protein
MASVPAEIQTEHFPNMIQERYRYVNPSSKYIVV